MLGRASSARWWTQRQDAPGGESWQSSAPHALHAQEEGSKARDQRKVVTHLRDFLGCSSLSPRASSCRGWKGLEECLQRALMAELRAYPAAFITVPRAGVGGGSA